eukprot:c6305_g1_i1.p1 GENE.c6305_g1_i1~~c6305_g1_i1.p1  ORF type:complete len:408 (-),score=56.48 c6305_g1_i1:93-1316(-)
MLVHMCHHHKHIRSHLKELRAQNGINSFFQNCLEIPQEDIFREAKSRKPKKEKHTRISPKEFDCFRYDSFTNLYPIVQLDLPKAQRDAEALLEQGVRFCDTKQSLDTLTVSPKWLSTDQGVRSFLDTMRTISRGCFLSQPCRTFWNASLREWVWEEVEWFSYSGYFTLAMYVCSRLEQALWRFYWLRSQKDPRVDRETRTWINEACKIDVALDPLRCELARQWQTWDDSDKRRLLNIHIGSFVKQTLYEKFKNRRRNSNNGIFREGDGVDANGGNPNKSHINAQLSLSTEQEKLSGLLGFLGEGSDTFEGLRIFHCMTVFSEEVIQDGALLMELLFLTPLSRMSSDVNTLLRHIGYRLLCRQSEHMALNLILAEERELFGINTTSLRYFIPFPFFCFVLESTQIDRS